MSYFVRCVVHYFSELDDGGISPRQPPSRQPQHARVVTRRIDIVGQSQVAFTAAIHVG
jgi:hypothetical protein